MILVPAWQFYPVRESADHARQLYFCLTVGIYFCTLMINIYLHFVKGILTKPLMATNNKKHQYFIINFFQSMIGSKFKAIFRLKKRILLSKCFKAYNIILSLKFTYSNNSKSSDHYHQNSISNVQLHELKKWSLFTIH